MMRRFKIILAFLLLSSLTKGQSLPKWLNGTWIVTRYENLKTGEVSYGPNGATTIHFLTDGKYYHETCNGGGGTFSVQSDTLLLNSGPHSYKFCLGWEGIIEHAFGLPKLKFNLRRPKKQNFWNGFTLELIAENDFLLTLSK